jgi:GTPase
MGSIPRNIFDGRLTQLNYRLKIGNGCAFYQIGVQDKGHVIGLKDECLREDMSVMYFLA